MRDEFIHYLKILARECRKELSLEMLKIYVEGFERIGFDHGVSFIKETIASRKDRDQFPTPFEMMRFFQADLMFNPEQVAGQIIAAISKFGVYHKEYARKSLGEDAWTAVEGYGGWTTICEIKVDQVPTVRSQLIKLLISTKEIARAKQLQGHNNKYLNS